ncbi:hypothetical protein D3C77_200130 [compost metagenome]
MERAGFLEPGAFSDLGNTHVGFAQAFEGRGAANFILDLLERAAFTFQLPAETAGTQALALGHGHQRWPLALITLTQVAVYLGHLAAVVAVANHQPLRGTAQKRLEPGEVLDHRQTQIISGKFNLAHARPQLQIGAPEQRIIVLRRAHIRQRGAIDDQALPAQPAQQADHQGQKSLVGIHPGHWIFDT